MQPKGQLASRVIIHHNDVLVLVGGNLKTMNLSPVTDICMQGRWGLSKTEVSSLDKVVL